MDSGVYGAEKRSRIWPASTGSVREILTISRSGRLQLLGKGQETWKYNRKAILSWFHGAGIGCDMVETMAAFQRINSS